MKKVVFSVLMTLFATIAMAQESQTEYNFLRLPVSAHAGALGGDNITIIEDDPSLMFNNPALLGSVSDKTINLNFMTYMKGSFTASASFNKAINERAEVAVMGQFVNYGSMKEMDEHNVQTGEFSAKDIAISGAFSYELTQRLVGGITATTTTRRCLSTCRWVCRSDLLARRSASRQRSLTLTIGTISSSITLWRALTSSSHHRYISPQVTISAAPTRCQSSPQTRRKAAATWLDCRSEQVLCSTVSSFLSPTQSIMCRQVR